MQSDPLSDALDALLRLGLDPTACRRAISDVRRQWGGSQAYIRAIDRSARDASIYDGLRQGLPASEVAARAQTSVATVRRRKSEWL